jgi:hypothetical protein
LKYELYAIGIIRYSFVIFVGNPAKRFAGANVPLPAGGTTAHRTAAVRSHRFAASAWRCFGQQPRFD